MNKWTTGVVGIEIEYPYTENEAEETLGNALYDVDSVGYTHEQYDSFVIKHDSSCGVRGQAGCELVSPPVALEQLTHDIGQGERMRHMFGILTSRAGDFGLGPEDFERCGIHVHVGLTVGQHKITTQLNRARIDRLWRSYTARREGINAFAGQGRDPLASEHARQYCDGLALTNKYGQVNISPVMSGTYDTIEFRQLGHSFQPYGSIGHYVTQPCLCGDPDCDMAGQEWVPPSTHGARLHSWADIVEWATFCRLLCEGAAHTSGWVTAERDRLYGGRRPIDGGYWSDMWERDETRRVLP